MKPLGIASLLAAMLFAGCSAPVAINTPPVDVTLSARGTALQQKTFIPVALRTFQDVASGQRVWLEDLIGAQCSVTSPYFTAEVMTPARFLVPEVNGAPAPFKATCRANGQTAEQANGCYYFDGEAGSITSASGTCLRTDLSVIFRKD